MKRPLAYITAAWSGDRNKDTAQAVQYCRSVYEAGFSPMCPLLYLPLFLNNGIPEEHKSGIDMSREAEAPGALVPFVQAHPSHELR